MAITLTKEKLQKRVAYAVLFLFVDFAVFSGFSGFVVFSGF
jgi:hypothetical protein